MYHNRIKRIPDGQAHYYLITNRVTGGSFVFGDVEKTKLRDLLFAGESRHGYEVWDYVVMDNHYHAIIKVKDQNLMPREEVLRSWLEWKKLTIEFDPGDEILAKHRAKLHDVSVIVANFQQRFTQWFNRRHERWGRLFGGRFDSVLVEETSTLGKMMAYLALNPVRAGVVAEPSEYHWSGFGERMARGKLRENDLEVVRNVMWELGCPDDFADGEEAKVLERFWTLFRIALLGRSARSREVDVATVRDLLIKRGKPMDLTWSQRLMLRARFVTKGVAVGTRMFVDEVLAENRETLGYRKRREPVRAVAWDQFYSLKRHRKPID